MGRVWPHARIDGPVGTRELRSATHAQTPRLIDGPKLDAHGPTSWGCRARSALEAPGVLDVCERSHGRHDREEAAVVMPL
ncbi:MAG: hypothetical protein H0V18_18305 [Pyrinomonadaceae bacterium]|nr:hypothetical protein [Pyrinomonadaceae bacterium]